MNTGVDPLLTLEATTLYEAAGAEPLAFLSTALRSRLVPLMRYSTRFTMPVPSRSASKTTSVEVAVTNVLATRLEFADVRLAAAGLVRKFHRLVTRDITSG